MVKAAVIFANGCEESESLTIVDILRRAEIPCDIIGLDSMEIRGAHDVVMYADRIMDDSLEDYDMVILPGGYGARDAMLASKDLRKHLIAMHLNAKKIAAMCAAPEVLDQAGLLRDTHYTCYPGTADRMKSGIRVDDAVVIEGNIITAQGPALAYAFAYTCCDELGGDSLTVKKRMAYFNAFAEEEDND